MHKFEKLSALVDDEELLDGEVGWHEVAANDELRAKWGRYHLFGEVLRDEAASGARIDFTDEIQELIAAEATVLVPPRAARGWRRQVVGLAVAASVATVALLALRSGEQETAPELIALESPPLQSTTVAKVAPRVTPPANVTAALDVDGQRRLNGYLVNFNEQRSNRGVPGVHPYVRIVGFERESR